MKKLVLLAIAVIAVISAYFAYHYYIRNTSLAMISDVPISEKEYLLYLYEEKIRFEDRGTVEIWKVDFDGASAEDIAKQNAFETVALVKISNIEAKRRSISLNSSDDEKIKLYRDSILSNIGGEILKKINFTESDLDKLVSENALYLKLFDNITKNVSVSETAFEEYYNDYIETEKSNLVNYYVSHIFIKNTDENGNPLDSEEYLALSEEVSDIRAELLDGADFSEYITKYSDDARAIELKEFDDTNSYSVGDIPEIEIVPNGFYIYRIEEIEFKTDEEELRKKIHDEFLANQKKLFFENEYKKWKEKNVIEINTKLYEKIGLSDFE